MSDQHTDTQNLTYRVVTLEQTLALNTATVTELRGDVREMSRNMESLRTLAIQHETTGSAIERAFGEINKTNLRLEEYMREMAKSNDLRADEHVQWRTQHVKENAENEKTSVRFSAVALSATVFLGVIISLCGYIYANDRQSDQRAQANDQRDKDTATNERRELDHRQDRVEQILIQMCAERGKECKPFR